MSAGGPSGEEPEDIGLVETEAEWLRCAEPGPLIDYLNGNNPHDYTASRRKFFLFGAACVRRVWHLLTRPESRAMVEAAEAFADGGITEERLDVVWDTAEFNWTEWPGGRGDPGLQAAVAAARLSIDGRGNHGNAELTPYAVDNVIEIAGLVVGPMRSDAWWAGKDAESRVLADLFRCVMGNPFRPVAFLPEWRTPTAVAVARGMYELRDFSGMPVLADALEDAGCSEPAVLGHCRDPKGLHVRGCWVVDLVLDREPPPVVGG